MMFLHVFDRLVDVLI